MASISGARKPWVTVRMSKFSRCLYSSRHKDRFQTLQLRSGKQSVLVPPGDGRSGNGTTRHARTGDALGRLRFPNTDLALQRAALSLLAAGTGRPPGLTSLARQAGRPHFTPALGWTFGPFLPWAPGRKTKRFHEDHGDRGQRGKPEAFFLFYFIFFLSFH